MTYRNLSSNEEKDHQKGKNSIVFQSEKPVSLLLILVFLCIFSSIIGTCAFAEEKNGKEGPLPGKNADQLVEDIDLRNAVLLYLSDPGYSSTQGMCVVDNRYIVVGRYKTDGSRDLMVYDVENKVVRASNVFKKTNLSVPDRGTNVDLEHLNGLTYENGYIYVPRSGSHRDILRLKFNDDVSIVYDAVAWKAEDGMSAPVNLSCCNGIFYWTGTEDSEVFHIYRSTQDFSIVEQAFVSSFGGLVEKNAIVKQGMAFDGNKLFFAFTGRLSVSPLESVTDHQRLMRNTEKIIISNTDGEILRTLSFPRGSYGEIEDVDTITIAGNTYLLINCNQNDDGVACVYAVSIYQNNVPAVVLETSNMQGSLFYDRRDFEVYCDNRPCYLTGSYNVLKSNPFASGMTQDRFTSVYAALSYIKNLDIPATLYLTGKYDSVEFKNLPAGINIVLDNAELDSLSLTQCPGIIVSGKNKACLGRLKVEKSLVILSQRIQMERPASGNEHAIEISDSVLTGSLYRVVGYKEAVCGLQSFVNISISESDFPPNTDISSGSGSLIFINEERQLRPQSTSHTFTTYFLGHRNKCVVVKSEKNVMLSLALGDGTPFAGATGSDPVGILPNGCSPAADIFVPAVAADNATSSGAVTPCMLHITSNGEITVNGDAELISAAKYILATATYITQ